MKSAKGGRMNLAGSYAIIRGNEGWLLNSSLPAYQPKNAPADYQPDRSRRLLLKRDELRTLTGRLHEKGLTLVPLSAYVKNSFIKISLGLGKSRKGADKREYLKKRTIERETEYRVKQ